MKPTLPKKLFYPLRICFYLGGAAAFPIRQKLEAEKKRLEMERERDQLEVEKQRFEEYKRKFQLELMMERYHKVCAKM